jgi:hypothetical protein
MSSESVCQAARSWVDVGSFRTRLVVRFMNFTASVRNMLDTPSYNSNQQGTFCRDLRLLPIRTTLRNISWQLVTKVAELHVGLILRVKLEP